MKIDLNKLNLNSNMIILKVQIYRRLFIWKIHLNSNMIILKVVHNSNLSPVISSI